MPPLTAFIADLFIDRLPLDQLRANYRAGHYGRVNPEHIKGYVDMGRG